MATRALDFIMQVNMSGKDISDKPVNKLVYAHGHPALLVLIEKVFLNRVASADLSNVSYYDASEISTKRLCDEISHDVGKKVVIIRNAENITDDSVVERYDSKYVSANVHTLFLSTQPPIFTDKARKIFVGLNEEEKKNKVKRSFTGQLIDGSAAHKATYSRFISTVLRTDTPTSEHIAQHFSYDPERLMNFIKIVRSAGINITKDNLSLIADEYYGNDLALCLLSRNKADALKAARAVPASEVLGCLNLITKRLEQLETLSEAEHSKVNVSWLIREGRISQGLVQTMGKYVRAYPLDIIDRCFEAVGEAYSLYENPDAKPLLWLAAKWPS